MPIVIADFEVTASKNINADSTNLEWEVLVKVRFASEDPAEWGEFRAFAGGWIRSSPGKPGVEPIRTAHDRRKLQEHGPQVQRKAYEKTSLLFDPSDKYADFDSDLKVTQEGLPLWVGQVPSEFEDRPIRLGNDQHVEIFYKRPVPGVDRSRRRNYGKNRYRNIKGKDVHRLMARDPYFDEEPSHMEALRDTIDGLRSDVQPIQDAENIVQAFNGGWHIVARDEPSREVDKSAHVDYWHQAEFQIREPQSLRVIERKRIFLRVRGTFPTRKYSSNISR